MISQEGGSILSCPSSQVTNFLNTQLCILPPQKPPNIFFDPNPFPPPSWGPTHTLQQIQGLLRVKPLPALLREAHGLPEFTLCGTQSKCHKGARKGRERWSPVPKRRRSPQETSIPRTPLLVSIPRPPNCPWGGVGKSPSQSNRVFSVGLPRQS